MPTRTQQSDLLSAAYASHGDTKQIVLFPEDPKECFDFGADAFDLADRLQTPILVLSDLDIGMNEWLCRPLTWDDDRRMDRGKVMTREMLDEAEVFGRYLDVDGDGIPYRTYPGAHPTKGAYFTRGTSRDRYARYSEDGAVYVENMERLERKFETAKELIPKPVHRRAEGSTRYGVIYYGSTSPALDEALDLLRADDIEVDTLRIRAFPFHEMVKAFVAQHERTFLIEQNRDAQMKTLLVAEERIDPAKVVSILHYDGTPITARFIVESIAARLQRQKVVPIRGAAS
jgi:2-oxoglutarate ferredoxin oxidoreductase subunit alpha